MYFRIFIIIIFLVEIKSKGFLWKSVKMAYIYGPNNSLLVLIYMVLITVGPNNGTTIKIFDIFNKWKVASEMSVIIRPKDKRIKTT